MHPPLARDLYAVSSDIHPNKEKLFRDHVLKLVVQFDLVYLQTAQQVAQHALVQNIQSSTSQVKRNIKVTDIQGFSSDLP